MISLLKKIQNNGLVAFFEKKKNLSIFQEQIDNFVISIIIKPDQKAFYFSIEIVVMQKIFAIITDENSEL